MFKNLPYVTFTLKHIVDKSIYNFAKRAHSRQIWSHLIANCFLLGFVLKNGPILASFCLFSSFSNYNFNNTNWKKHRWCAWDSNPGPQDGRRRRNHGAMAATQLRYLLVTTKSCGGLAVSGLAVYSADPSSNPAEVLSSSLSLFGRRYTKTSATYILNYFSSSRGLCVPCILQ